MTKEFNLEAVKRAIQNGWITFDYSHETTICRIGGGWFYFLASEDDGMTPEEFKNEYTINEQAEQIYNILSNPDGYLSEREADHHRWYIMYHS